MPPGMVIQHADGSTETMKIEKTKQPLTQSEFNAQEAADAKLVATVEEKREA